jgi:hypothetical protein
MQAWIRVLEGGERMRQATDHHQHRIVRDVGLVAANLLMLLVAVRLGWSPFALLWPLWLQSLVIGWFARQRLLAHARAHPASGLQPAAADCFALHFGLFHGAQLVFLLAFTGMADGAPLLPDAVGGAADTPMLSIGISGWGWLLLAVPALAFAHVHALAARTRLREARVPALMPMFMPYLRVVPMQVAVLALLLAGTESVAAVVAVKAMVDIGSARLCEHVFARGAQSIERVAARA